MSQNVIYGPRIKGALPFTSLGSIFYRKLKSNLPETTLLIDSRTNESISNSKFLSATISIAKLLTKIGIKKNDIVTIISYKSWEYLSVVLASFYIGATVNLLNEHYEKGEINHFFKNCQPKVIFCSLKSWKVMSTYLSANPSTKVIFMDNNGPDNIPSICSTINEEKNSNQNFFTTEVDIYENIAMIFLSSGTTGLPKAVMLTHSNLRNTFSYLGLPDYMHFNDQMSVINFLPFFHIYGLIVALSSILYSSKLIIMERFKPLKFLSLIEEHKINAIFGVTPVALFLVQDPCVEDYNLSSVKAFYCGGAPIPKSLQNELKQRFPNITQHISYGMTETSLAATVTPIDKAYTVGKVTPNHQIIVCDISGNILGPYQIGELRIKGAGVMKGYLNNEEATKQAFDCNGYLKTGDLGYYDQDECFTIVARLKEIIKYKGFQVPPVELENLILQLEGVEDVGVVGMPDKRAGELPVAFVVKKRGAQITENDVILHVQNNISIQKHLHGGVKFVNQIPKTMSGKILRERLRSFLKY